MFYAYIGLWQALHEALLKQDELFACIDSEEAFMSPVSQTCIVFVHV